jgi:subtilisin family serine protease
VLGSRPAHLLGDILKILIPLITLVQLTTANASLIGIMDSGADISHNDLVSKTWVNKNEKLGSLVDLDNDGLPGDVNGWDFTENSATVFNNKYNGLITADVKKFYNYYSMFELGKLTKTSPELLWLKAHTQDKELMNKVNFIGGYIHGTHVAGISALNNAQSKILSLKIIPTVYKEFKVADQNAPKTEVNDAPVDSTPGISVEEFTSKVLEDATAQISQMVVMHGFLDFHKVDVVNQSFGIGFGDAVNFIKEGFITDVKRTPKDEEVALIVKQYFGFLFTNGQKMFEAAPNTVFTIAAGNDSLNNDLFPDFPADIQADNKIVVAATLGYKALAEFSNYGATRVDVAAPGVAITSTAPTNVYIALSGTSQATPFVTNTIAAMKDLNPSLTVRDLKAIILGTVDVKVWLKGKVKTSGIVNRARALKAAEFAKTQALDLAISKARVTIMDVAVEKSLVVKSKDLKIDFKPIRPSLLIPLK